MDLKGLLQLKHELPLKGRNGLEVEMELQFCGGFIDGVEFLFENPEVIAVQVREVSSVWVEFQDLDDLRRGGSVDDRFIINQEAEGDIRTPEWPNFFASAVFRLKRSIAGLLSGQQVLGGNHCFLRQVSIQGCVYKDDVIKNGRRKEKEGGKERSLRMMRVMIESLLNSLELGLSEVPALKRRTWA